MKLFSRLFRRPPKAMQSRNFAAATSSRLVMDWIVAGLSADAAVQPSLATLRDRSRDLERNNEWARGYLRTLENNTIGEAGIGLQLRIKDPVTGRMDEIANSKIEDAWWNFRKVGNFTIDGTLSGIEAEKLIVRTIARDGEILVRKIVTDKGLRLQLIEPDLLDHTYTIVANNGNSIRLGVESDANRKVVAYHLLGAHPGDSGFQATSQKRVRVPAAEIMHLFVSDRPGQSRGVPWLAASMKAMKMLAGYAEAELVAARTGAAKMGFFTKQAPDGWTGESDSDGNLTMDASPGTIEELPIGVDFKAWSNDHPNAGFGDFVKYNLRGIATSLGISYNTLSSDLEGVNYSSIRAGLLEEREVWKSIQRFLIEHFEQPLFEEWLVVELLSGRLGLPYEKLWKFNVPEFQGRRWPWVDPLKDMEANILAIRSGQTSLRKVISQAGGDIYDTLLAQKADNELAASLGVTLPELTDPPKPAPVPAKIDTQP